MKNYLILVSMSWVGHALLAQNDTTFINIREEQYTENKQILRDRYDDIFGTHEETGILFKIDFAKFIPSPRLFSLEQSNWLDYVPLYLPAIGLEAKLHPSLSIHMDAALGAFTNTDGYIYELSLEGRYYYQMLRRMRQGRSANNLSGNYFALSASTEGSGSDNRPQTTFYSLRYGLQRRLFKRGFIDASYGMGVVNQGTFTGAGVSRLGDIVASGKIMIGLAFGPKGQSKETSGYWCDVLTCFREERRMLRIDLMDALTVRNVGWTISPKIEYEQKLGSSPTSLTAGVGAYWFKAADWLPINNFSSLNFFLEPRYYFTQRKNIARGKSGNNLSGAFIGLYGGYSKPTQSTSSIDPYTSSMTIAPVVGVQYRVFRKGFISYKTGLGYLRRGGDLSDYAFFVSDLKLGFAF
jgi:hypothetical protein